MFLKCSDMARASFGAPNRGRAIGVRRRILAAKVRVMGDYRMKAGTIIGVLGTAAAAVAIVASAPARAATINPVSYTLDVGTDTGSYVYDDSTGMELIDGVYGYEGWAVDSAPPWVGWTDYEANIVFDFGVAATINKVSVGSTQDALNDVVLPNIFVYSSDDAVSWVLRGSLLTPPSADNNRDSLSTAPHGFLDVAGLSYTSRYTRVQTTANGPWSFVDEVDFTGELTGVPEPSSWLLMLVGFFGLGAMLRAGREGIAPN